MKNVISFVFVLFCCGGLDAKPRVKVFPVSCARVWKAVETVANGKDYSSSMLDDKRMKASLVTGHGEWTGKRTMYLCLQESGDSSSVYAEGSITEHTHTIQI